MKFTDLPLAEPLLRAVGDCGYLDPTPIQEQAIPPAVQGRDLLGCAQTGTGKTAAFALPILQRLSSRTVSSGVRPIRALILTPTRELAIQIGDSFRDYGRYLPLRYAVVFGGVSQKPQEEALRRGTDILVATPGRLNDLIGQGLVRLDRLEILVLDEADRMLDMGFIHDVKRVLAKTPEKKQTLLFSATIPPEIAEIARGLLHQPVKVAVTPVSSAVDSVTQRVYRVDKANKRRLLQYLLEDPSLTSVLVFTRTKHGADRVARDLVRAGIPAKAIHGNKSQNARQLALKEFKEHALRVLVATDIAARGIDINELPFVVNFDLPDVPETYVHRIGRTGRAGRFGTSLSFCDIAEEPLLRDIEKLLGHPVEEETEHPFPRQVLEVPPREPRSAPPAPHKKAAPVGSVSSVPGQGEAVRRKRRRRRKPAGPAAERREDH